MSGSGTPAPSGKSNVALIISLCINLILVGIVAVPIVRMHFFAPPFGGPGMMGGPGHGRGMMLWQMQQSLTPQALERGAPDKADKIKAIIDAHRDRFRELGKASFDARRDAFQVFGQPAFDKKAFDASLDHVQAADAALEKEILSVVSESATTLSPEERKAIVLQHDHRRGLIWHHGLDRDFVRPPPPPPHPDDED